MAQKQSSAFITTKKRDLLSHGQVQQAQFSHHAYLQVHD